MFKSLAIPSFRWLWTGQLLSQFGNSVFLVMALWEIQLKDPVLLSLAGLAMMLPQLLAAVGGIVVDRMDAARLMLWTDVMRGAAVLLGLLVLVGAPAWRPWIIIVLLAVNALGNALFGPAESVVMPRLVAESELPSANGLYSVTFQLSNAIGAAIGGAAIAAVGVSAVFGFDLGSFWFSALAILLMMRAVAGRFGSLGAKPAKESPPAPGFREGWKAISGLRWFVILLPLILLGNFTGNGAFLVLPYWIHHHLHATATWYGIASASWAMGTVFGSLSGGVLGRFSLRKTVGVLGFAEGVLMLVFALAKGVPMASGAFLLAGAANGGLNVLLITLMQKAVPEEVRGRAFGLLMTVLNAASPLAAAVIGLTLTTVPVIIWYLASAFSACMLGVGLWMIMPDKSESGPTAEAMPVESL